MIIENDDVEVIYKYLDEDLRSQREESLIKFLNHSENYNELDFYDLGMYILNREKNARNIIEDKLCESVIDTKISLTSEQIEILDILDDNNLFLSAPTSFGKTFIILEYIKRNYSKIKNVIFIVPTLALMNELLRKIYNIFSNNYNICINGSETFEESNIFIFVPERSDSDFGEKVRNMDIDLLVIDEIYKLQVSKSMLATDDRIILMNKTYLELLKKAKKVVLLGPFINDVNFGKTNLDIVKFYSNYSPVYNKITYIDKEVWPNYVDYSHSQLIYFSSPDRIYKNMGVLLQNISEDPKCLSLYSEEINYLSNYVNPDWYVIKLLKRGIGVHHGKTPIFLRKFFETEFNNGNIKVLLCTNTLMEGINTPTDRLIVVDDPGGAFELYNLIGRVARLNPQNPKIGEVFVCGKKLKDKYTNTNSWRSLTILAEKEEAGSLDEIVYFESSYEKNNKLKDEYSLKKDLVVNKYGINLEEIKSKNLKFGKVYTFLNDDYKGKFMRASSFQDCVNLSVKLLLNISNKWKISRFNNLNSEIDYLPYKNYISLLLIKQPIKSIIANFNLNFNKSFNQENINLFVDALLDLEKNIKFKLTEIISYLDLVSIDIGNNKHLKDFYISLKVYNDNPVGIKILDDLGIESIDYSNILSIINVEKDSTSTSRIIREIKKHKNEIINSLNSPFSKSNINSL